MHSRRRLTEATAAFTSRPSGETSLWLDSCARQTKASPLKRRHCGTQPKHLEERRTKRCPQIRLTVAMESRWFTALEKRPRKSGTPVNQWLPLAIKHIPEGDTEQVKGEDVWPLHAQVMCERDGKQDWRRDVKRRGDVWGSPTPARYHGGDTRRRRFQLARSGFYVIQLEDGPHVKKQPVRCSLDINVH